MTSEEQQIASEFDQYKSLSTDEERQLFWSDVENRTNELTPDQRLFAQTAVRENIERILRRMETIADRLTITQNV